MSETMLDQLLYALENPTRRKILEKLATETHYPLQLSKELNVSQQAIMKHLKVLEDLNLVESFDEKSDVGGPPRKSYIPTKSYTIKIDIGPNTFNVEMDNFDAASVEKDYKKIENKYKTNHLSEPIIHQSIKWPRTITNIQNPRTISML